MPRKDDDPLLNRPAPHFCLPGTAAPEVCIENFRGNWVVLYFYPRDNTPGCTIEAMEFNAALPRFSDLGARVIGLSGDSVESHREFQEKHSLEIPLLSDTGHAVLEAFGSWKPKTLAGHEFFGTRRDTFLIDPAGTVVAVWRDARPVGHAAEVMEALLAKQREPRPADREKGRA